MAADSAEGGFGMVTGFDVVNDLVNIWRPGVVRHVAGSFMSDRGEMTVIFCSFDC